MVKLIFQELKTNELVYRNVKSENILAKQSAEFFRYAHPLLLSLAQCTKANIISLKWQHFLYIILKIRSSLKNCFFQNSYCRMFNDIVCIYGGAFEPHSFCQHCMEERRELQWVLERGLLPTAMSQGAGQK